MRSVRRVFVAALSGVVIMLVSQSVSTSAVTTASPGVSSADQLYLAMLREGPGAYGGITPAPGFTEYDLAQGGHQIAAELRRGVSPEAIASSIWKRSSQRLEFMQARWMVYSAVCAFAPEFMPIMETSAWFPGGNPN